MDCKAGRQRDSEQVDGKRPDQIEEARDDSVCQPAEVAAEEAEDKRQEGRGECGTQPDEQRNPTAVEKSDEEVATVRIGTEQVGPSPAGPDRRPVIGDDRDVLAPDPNRAVEVLNIRSAVADEMHP